MRLYKGSEKPKASSNPISPVPPPPKPPPLNPPHPPKPEPPELKGEEDMVAPVWVDMRLKLETKERV